MEINPKGLRDFEYKYEKDSDRFRIMILGDSFSEAFTIPLNDTFHKRLEKKLNKSGLPKIEVINTGVSGFGTDNELLFFIHEGYKYEPDLVLLLFNLGNDVTDNFQGLAFESRKPHFILEGGNLKHQDQDKDNVSLIGRTKKFLRTNELTSLFFRV